MSERRKGESNVLGSAESPYSKGLMARALTAVGLREDEAYERRGGPSPISPSAARCPSTSTGCRSSRATTSAPSGAPVRSASSGASATCRSSTCP